MLVKTLKRALAGFVLGMAVGNLIAALTGGGEIVAPALLARAGGMSAALLWQTLLSGVIGAAGMGGMTLYELDRWPLAVVELAHYALYMAVFIPIGIYLGWFAYPLELLLMAAIMLTMHFGIFLIMCAIYRKQVKELNKLNERRSSKNNQKIMGGAV